MSAPPAVLVTLSHGTLEGLEARLAARGLPAQRRPLLAFEPPKTWSPVDRAINELADYPSVVVTSPRAAGALVARHRQLGSPAPHPEVRVWASGQRTAGLIQPMFATAEPWIPAPADRGAGSAEALAMRMLDEEVRGPVLFPCGERHREVLPQALADGGVRVVSVVCYRTVMVPLTRADTAVRSAGLIVVASPHVARTLARSFSTHERRPGLVALGPATARAARGSGWSVVAVARAPTLDGVMEAMKPWTVTSPSREPR